MNLPGLSLHQLTGDRSDIWSVKVSGNWRVTFRMVIIQTPTPKLDKPSVL